MRLLNVKHQIIAVICTFLNILSSSHSNGTADQSASSMDEIKVDSNSEDVKTVIVIGGGVAGMTAARILTNHRGFDVTVFEACADRYGGRVWTDRRGAKDVRGIDGDLGPMFLNSKVTDNPLVKLVTDLELTVKKFGPAQLYVPHQDKVIKGEEVGKVFTDFIKIVSNAVEKAKLSSKDYPSSEAFQTELETSDIQTDKSIIKGLIESHYAAAVPDYSAQLFSPDKHFGFDIGVVDGFDQLVDGLVGGLEAEIPVAVELDTVVRQIEVDKKRGKVVVRTTDLKQHLADAVVVALPLGVLKNESVIFEPPLPTEWYKTAEKIGISYSNKIALEFDEAFWPENVTFFTLIPSDPSEYGIFQAWINILYFNDKPVLKGTIRGEAAKDFERMKDEDVKSQALSVLAKMFGEETVRNCKVTRMRRSRWQSDPYTLGANTYPIHGLEEDYLQYLSDPVCPYIYFAGEYTDEDYSHTTLGASNSGMRAANQLIDRLCEKKRKTEEEEKQKEKKQRQTKEPETTKDEL